TLYARYPNKEEIFAATIARMLDAPDDAPPSTAAEDAMTIKALFLKVARDLIARAEKPSTAALSRLIYAEAHQAAELVRLSEEIYRRALGPVFEALALLRASGEAPTQPADQIAAPLFMEMVVSTPRSLAILGQPMPRALRTARTEAAVDLF